MSKRITVLVVVIGLLVGGIIAGVNMYQNRHRTMSIVFSHEAEDLEVGVFKATEYDKHGSPTAFGGDSLYVITGSRDIQLRPGGYIASTVSEERYKAIEQPFIVVDGGAIELEVRLNEQPLAELLEERKSTIEDAFRKQITNGQNVTIIKVELYKTGDIAGIVFSQDPLDDYFKVVLEKNNDTWSIITDPSILISVVKYPNIPQEVIRSLNEHQYTVGEQPREGF